MFKALILSCFVMVAPTDGGPGDSSMKDLTGIKCVVSGNPVHRRYNRPYKQGKLYFDCNASRMKFESAKAAFVVKANHQLAVTQQYVQIKCPLKARTVSLSNKIVLPIAGVEIGMCCATCRQSLVSLGEIQDQIQFIFADKKFDAIFVPRSTIFSRLPTETTR